MSTPGFRSFSPALQRFFIATVVNMIGSAMLFGDVYARVGDKTSASSYYTAALSAPSSSNWLLRADAQAALDGLDARAAAWTDADPANDPAFFLSGKRTCTACHQ